MGNLHLQLLQPGRRAVVQRYEPSAGAADGRAQVRLLQLTPRDRADGLQSFHLAQPPLLFGQHVHLGRTRHG